MLLQPQIFAFLTGGLLLCLLAVFAMFYASAEQFRTWGRDIIDARQVAGRNRRRSAERESRRFKAFFSVKAERASEVWSLLIGYGLCPAKAEPQHLLWALLFLKLYATEDVNESLIGHDSNTVRKWTWIMVEALHDLSKKLVRITTKSYRLKNLH